MATYYWVNVPAGQTVHLRSTPDLYMDNVIMDLPRGTRVMFNYTMSPFYNVTTDDGHKGYVHQNFISSVPVSLPSNDPWVSRYGSSVWQKKKHYNTYYSAVKNIQTDLLGLGYDVGSADGYYGNKTETGVMVFQGDYGLSTDGKFGDQSKTALWNAVNN